MAQQQYQSPNRNDVREMYEYQTFSPNKAIFGITAIAVIGFFGYKFMTNMSEAKDKEAAANAIQDDNNAQVALALKSAIYNVGISTWLATFDQDKAWALADRITSLKEVRKYYHIYHNRDLDADLQAQASAEELVEFMNRANKTKTQAEVEAAAIPTSNSGGGNTAPVEVKDDSIKGMYVVVKSSVGLAKVRRIPNQGGIMNGYNELYRMPKGKMVGIATGKYVKDIENNVGFIEVAFRIDTATWNWAKVESVSISMPKLAPDFYEYLQKLGTSKHTQQKVWLPKSMVNIVPLSDYEQVIKPNNPEIAWFSSVTLSGLTSDAPQLAIKKGHAATIYDSSMKVKGIATDMHILGGLISTLQTPNGDIFQFETEQGKTRLVHAQHVRIM